MKRWRHIFCAALMAGLPQTASAAQIWEIEPLIAAEYTEPTGRYPHGALGDTIEFGALKLTYLPMGTSFTIRLPHNSVFEDVAPRMVDVDGDGRREAIVVESHKDKGARLAIYNGGGLIAATDYIGRRFRWLAPIGAADLDGDGHIEIAYIDRPHLAKTLRVVRFKDGRLTEIAMLEGVTNHRIGERDIGGGIRTCAGNPEMVVVRADWRRVMVVKFENGRLMAEEAGVHKGRASLNRALKCK